jgi:hypothetical protein
MTISNNRAAGQAGATRHSSLSLGALAAVTAGLLCVALPPQAARAAGSGLQSGIVCPASAPYRIYVYGVWRCYECDRDTPPEECKAKREKREAAERAARRQRDLRNAKIPCWTAPCSPGAAAALKREGTSSGGSEQVQPSGERRRNTASGGSSAVDRLSGGGAPRAPLGSGQSGGGAGTRSSASAGASSAAPSGGGSSAPNIGTNAIMRAGGSTPGQSQSPGLR